MDQRSSLTEITGKRIATSMTSAISDRWRLSPVRRPNRSHRHTLAIDTRTQTELKTNSIYIEGYIEAPLLVSAQSVSIKPLDGIDGQSVVQDAQGHSLWRRGVRDHRANRYSVCSIGCACNRYDRRRAYTRPSRHRLRKSWFRHRRVGGA